MKIIKSLFVAIASFLIASPVLAQTCTLNGEVVPCDQMPTWIWFLPVIMVVIFGAVFVFWLWMLIDAIKNQKDNQTVWILVIVFTGIIGAIIYYFMEKRNHKQ
ncbi:hypothetical protein A2533_01080 [Candidatus Falkowbacteria bacterium RIFOXYD2_FULL_35_9]|uniref:Cardiolipin synthase N-terminal domain-containing protein n=1 Tax=Candidatus Falkowbacteria bacterium RIFOXYC2_FULL_36_12 TaxID=1798002 RepID=A0A1F5T4F8_9BACT|nr:MAG: hypothetical protein A2300_01300 [Candidatus Falkowbacteria bacterium RIFOXYB2_FULL_35_7]OGF33341.1 MAG: hypothetical protein A2478_01410 [Candidatus Falkowbacteria bacterium RIFOXYC2_FULL_36_12]OGF34224.1 MAG: hypothetical protein A2223_03725 [Candidatus Falkowbacteria bacterium RIFOXYA2_FULL_35_8]OGF47907.1 MAG: hypothetical protein A2533_01080 [Candidatus Falkowbacteria bacterium RIFOXYD2_FULL_35_9]